MLDTYAHDFTPGAPGDRRVLVLLHGTGGERRGFDALGAAVAPGAARLSLDGDVLEGPHRRFFRRKAEGVYDLDDLALRRTRFAAFLAAAGEAYGFDPARADALGYSNGANLIAAALLADGPVVGRAVLMHPLIPYPVSPPSLSGVKVMVTGGKRDPIAPLAMTGALVGTLEDAGAEASLTLHEGGHELRETEVAAAAAFLAVPAMAEVG
ncbi:MAG: alpha/beta hydrolase [Pseudomonadota bacterium]